MPLHLAAMHGHLEACKELMAAGAPLEHRNKVGMQKSTRQWRVVTLPSYADAVVGRR